MSVLKLTRKDITSYDSGNDSGGKIKLKKSDLIYDAATYSTWEQANKEALSVLNQYNERVNNNEWLSSDDLASYRKALDSYISTSNSLRGVNKIFGSGYSPEEETEWSNFVNSATQNYDSLSEYYSQWKSADAYQADYNAYQLRQELSSADLSSLQLEIDDLQKKVDRYYEIGRKEQEILSRMEAYNQERPGASDHIAAFDSMLAPLRQEKASLEGVEAALEEKKRYYKQAEAVQKPGIMQGEAKGAPDFETNKVYVSTEATTWRDKWRAQYGLGYNDLTYEYINNRNGLRSEIKRKYDTYSSDNPWAESESDFEQKGYDFLTEEEVSVYNYFYSTQGKDKAQEYLDSLESTLVQRKAANEFANLEGRTLAEIFYGVVAGTEQFRQGLENFGSMVAGTEGFTPSSQYVSGMVREDLEDNGFKVFGSSAGQLGYDLLNTTSNMLPSILVGSVTGGFGGAATLGASATGNAYAEMRRLGYDRWQSTAYAGLVGASETTLQYALGGIGKLGGKISGNAIGKLVSRLDNAIARTAITLGGNMASEGLEEAIQTVLEPAFKALVTGEDFESPEWDEVLYSALLGALSAGALEGVPTIYGTVSQNIEANNEASKLYGDGSSVVGKSLSIDPNNAYAKKMQAKLDKGKSLSGGQIKRLLKANDTTLRSQDISKIESAVEARLTELGEQGDVKQLSKILAKQVAGEALTSSEKAALKNSTYGERVANELDPDNIESGNYTSDWAEQIGTDKINAESYSRLLQDLATEQAPAADASQSVSVAENTSPAENATEEDIETIEQTTETSAEEESTASLEDLSKKYGAQAKAMVHTYVEGQDIVKFDKAYGAAYEMGKSGVALSYAMNSDMTSYLSAKQREVAYEAGAAASDAAARERDAKNKAAANGKTGRKLGTVQGQGVSISDLKKAFNDTQNKAHKILSTLAEATGIDIVLYKSEANADGDFEGAQGKFKWSDDKIYIDINAGLKNIKSVDDLAKYAMLRSFSHEFTHFLEKWNPVRYNEFRQVVFETLTARGENVHDLIEAKQAVNPGMTYDQASREVVAEAMTDILPDSHFVETLATKHRNIFEKLLDKLKGFLADIKAYFNAIGHNRSREANALKEQVGEAVHYVENVVQLFDKVAVEAVENYQMTVALEEVSQKTEIAEPQAAQVSNTLTVAQEEDGVAKEYPMAPLESSKPKAAAPQNESAMVEIEPSIEEREKAYKKKFSQWLKKAYRQYVLRYGGERFLSDGAFGMRATEDEIGWAKLEFSGRIAETDIPKQAADALDDATNLVTEAPLEGGTGQDSVYVFNFDGKQAVYNKKLLSKLDGNLFYVGDFMKGAKILKAVDAEGNVTGFLLPLKTNPDTAIANTKPSKLKSFSKKMQSLNDTATPKEVKPNGQNADNRGTVQQPVGDRQEDSLVLERLQAEDVSGDAQRGNPVGGSIQRGHQTVRDDVRPDAERVSGRSGVGDSESGDLRRDDGLTPEAAEQLHEEVSAQIEQQSTENPKGKNFVIGESLDLPNGEKARYKANIEAIRLVKKLETEGRYATEAEQAILSKYVGWGGLANAFDERKAEWSKEYQELKELLTDEEYNLARGSTLNAHYTEISVIKAMYDGLKQLGFNGGRMMEPSSGVGNFVGAMPADMSAKVKSWTMVELDGITGLIAKHLYPNADVRIQGFEKANIPNNFMDVVISNVPFGNYPITDKAYPKKVTSAIHNYFFAKSLDKVRPGGIVMFITSSYTMNSKDSTVRRYIMQRADLLGAIRLPDTAFKANAGTEVVTDILILKKRPANTLYAGEDFLEAPYKSINGYNGAYINSYFDAHPEMILGTASMEGSMYRGASLTYKALEGKGSLADQIRSAFSHIKGKMDYPAQLSPEKTNFAVERAGKKTKQNGYVAKDGKIYQNKDGELVEQNVSSTVAGRIKGMLEIRDAAKALLNYQQQGLIEAEIKKARVNLNKLYDAFVKKYGFLNAPANKSAFKDDPDCFSLFALENWNNDEKKATKADIFSKNTIAPNRTVASAKDVSEGLIVSVNQTGGVDISLIAKLTGKTEADVTRELIDSRQAFKNRDGNLETAESYLSGNVRAKLRDAKALVSMDADYQKNVDALKAVMPADVGYQDIFVNPGTPWIPNSVYSDFAAYMLGSSNSEWRQAVDVTRNPETGNFTVELKNSYLKLNAANTQKWGTPRRSFLDLFDAMLNSKSVVIKNKLDDGTTVVDKDATAAANEKIENITKEFQEWLWKDEARRTELATLYNEVFNSIVTPKYNGDHLTVNGANAMKPLRPHQRNAVQRVISSGGNTLLAHKVGAGKTYEMAAAAMKLKQLGLVRKPMFVVPKSLVAQWGTEFIDFFPTAKLLVAEATDFATANRKIFMNRIANGEYDAVIVSYEQFEKLPVSDDFTRELYQEQINSVIAAIEEAKAEKGGKSLSVKDLEKKRKSLQAKIDKLTDKAKDEGNIDFEQLGVDSLFVDEAHNFKNLFYTTSMTNVSGLGNKDGSKRAFDLYTKVRYLQKLNGGRGIVFATATPVMNSMSEMYIMQKYLQPDLLDQLGLSTFDAWAKQFGEVVNGVEIKPSGQGYRVKQSFSRFKNMSELQLLFRNFADVLTDIPGLKIPKMKGGAVNVVVCEPGEFQQDYMKELEKRADNVKNVDPSVDNMLKITSDGRKISYTQRMIDPSLPYEEGCKIYRCADNVVRVYNESKSVKGTQLIFCDMATPKGKSKTESSETDDASMDMESAKLYDDIKTRLVQSGIPAKEIAFIHEADTDQKKKKLFADVNEGKVRVLIGSTGKMGVGMNAQRRVVAIHHLDAPWRPGDVEQRNGRAYRQGNINEEVECFTYVTEGSFDARLWDILERKQNFINQVMNGESVGRETEDTGEVTLSAAEVKALASGSPLIMEQVQLDTDIKKLESLYRAHLSSVRAAKERLVKDQGDIAILEKRLENGRSDVSSIKDTYSEGKFSITIGKQKFTEKKDAGVALMAAATAKAKDEYTTIGSFAGFDVRVIKTSEGIKGLIVGKQGYSFNTYPGNTTFMVNHLISVVEGIAEKVKAWESQLEATKADMAEQEKLIDAPFAKQADLDEKRKRYNEVMEILNPKEEQSLDSVAEDTVQEQSREYLDDDEDYPTYGVHWGIKKGIISKKDAAVVWGAIAKIQKLKYNSYPKTVYGDSFIESENHLMIVDTNFKNPIIRTIFKFNDSFETTMAQAKEVLIDAKGMESKTREACEIIESVYGSGHVTRYDFTNRQAYEWQIPRRKGSYSGTNLEGEIQSQQRTDTLTDREVLEMASIEIEVSDLSQAENDALTIFQERLSKLKKLQDDRAEQGRLYKEQQFGAKVDREAAKATLNRMHILDEQIQKATNDVLTVEEKAVLKRVLQKARNVVEVQERQHGQEILNRWRERRNNAAAIKKYRDRLRGDVDELTTWIISPDNKDIVKHVPDVLKNSVIPFLSSINFMSKRSLKGGDATASDKEFIKRLKALQSAIKINIDVYGMYSGYNDLPPNFMENLQNFIESAQSLLEKSEGEFIINQMTSAELKELSQVVRTLKKYIMQVNRFHNNAMYQHVYEAGDNSIDFLRELGNAGSHTGSLSNFVFWQQIRPAYAFERFGEGGKAIYDGLRQGQAKLAFNTKEIVSFSQRAYSEKEVKKWESEIKEFRLGSDIVRIPVSYIMGLYELSKDPEALVHIEGEGIRVATYSHKGKKISDVGHILTRGELNQILGSLTDRQRDVADSLQKYMAEQGGKWGNYVSVARFGEELFTNPKYYPINSDGRHLQTTAEEHPSVAALYALLNMSFTKSREEGASNRIVIYSIFDVFANHMASMAQYNAMALPILDALKWLNYQQVSIDEEGNKVALGNLREQMSRVYGVPEETKPGSGKQGYAETFIVNIIKGFNGTAAQGTPYDSLGLKSLHRYNIAQVAYNLRVLIQQPIAIVRARLLLDGRSIIKGMRLNPAVIRKNIEEMQKHSGIAAWKSLGFYDVNISRGLTSLIKHDSNWLDKIGDVGMWGAEKADTLTWAAIWNACKEEVMKKQHLTPTSEGFYEAVATLFEDVIYKTQVVDSILTKNEFMRDKGTFARLVGSFMSEPVTNASMVIDALDKYKLDIQRGMSHRDAWRKNGKKIGRTIYVYAVGAILLAAVQAAADGWRDDDEYEEWCEKWIEAFTGNLVDELMPFNKLPILSDFYDLAKELVSIFGVDTYGNPPQSVFMQWYDSLVKGVQIINDKITGENTNYTWYAGIYKLLQALSGMSGVPLASATREIISAWNNLIGYMAPSLKVITYEATQKELRNELYEAIVEGDAEKEKRIRAKFDDEKDVNAALRKALRENDPRTHEAAQAVIDRNPAERYRLEKEIVSEGKFSQEIVSSAINAEIEALREKKQK